MSKVICQHCSEERDKVFLKYYRSASIFVDAIGNRWYGTQCPTCYKKYKLDYDAKRRIQKGHLALGSELSCASCGNIHKLENGASPLCKACRNGKE